MSYCLKDAVKDRLLIAAADTSYDTALDTAITEASRLVDVFLKPYTTVPLTSPYPDQIAVVTADFSASIFRRRMMPDDVKVRGTLRPDQMGEMDATGWFAQGIKKIEEYIKSYYTLQVTVIGNIVHNPDIYITLFEKGVITAKEARTFLSTDFAVAHKTIDDITRTEALTKTSNITSTLVDSITRTLGETLTKDQIDNLTQTIKHTLTDTLTQNKNITSVEDLTKTLHDTLVDNIDRTLGERITRISGENINRTVAQVLNTTKADIESLTRTENITQVKGLTETDTITKTLNTDEIRSQYITRKQKSFSFIQSDEDSGYKQQT